MASLRSRLRSEATVPGTEIAATERRKALPWPLFPGDPGNKLRPLHTKVRRSALRLPLFCRERGLLKLPFTQIDLRAAVTLACKETLDQEGPGPIPCRPIKALK